MQPRLLEISGPSQGTIQLMEHGQLSIGRHKSNKLCLADPMVSREHCTIEQVDESHLLADLESHNGTFVNGIPIRRKELVHGDTIRIGACEFVFLTHESETTGGHTVHMVDDVAATTFDTVRIKPPAAFGIEVGRMARDLAALFRISNIINSIRDAAALQSELLRLIAEVVPADQAAVALLKDLDGDPDSITTWHRDPGAQVQIQMQRDLTQRAVWERAPVVADVPSASGEMQNVLCLPLVAVERTIGVIYLTSTHSAPAFREDHIHFLDLVSRIAAVTLENVLALDALRSENQQLKEKLNLSGNLIGESRQIRHLEDFIARVAHSDTTVLIRGESGTGKEVVARAIHQQSPRADRPFVAINCAAIPETLFESELFGYEKGAFTGAAGMKKGKLESVDDGTLFLDEIGELPPPMQAKLLRVLQQKEFERIGSARSIPFKARVLAATNKNLEQAIKSAEFRQDLYYRLNVVSTVVPPLREHRDDIPLLALFFASKYAEKSRRPFKGISRAARALLMAYSWPGNVRELENAIEHAIVLGLTDELLPDDLPGIILEEQSAALPASLYHSQINKKKEEIVLNALHEANGNFPAAARLLGIHPKYLHRLASNLSLRSKLD